MLGNITSVLSATMTIKRTVKTSYSTKSFGKDLVKKITVFVTY